MRNLLRSWFGARTRQARPANPSSRRRPVFETLEDRVVPSISNPLPTVASPGAVTLTGTSGPDQFMVRLQQSGTSGGGLSVVFSDGQTTTQPVPLSAVTSVVINGVGGRDTLTLDVGQNLLNGTNITSLLPIQFNGVPGTDVLNLLGSAGSTGGGGTTSPTITETFTLGTSGTASTLTLGTGSGTSANNLIRVTLTGPTALVDSLSGTNFVFNGTAGNDLISIRSQSRGGTTSLVIKGINAQDNGIIPGREDDDDRDEDRDDDQDEDRNDDRGGRRHHDHFTVNQTLTDSNAFPPITLTGKTNVTVNGLGGDDLFLVSLNSLPTGTTLTLDGGAGTNVVAARSLPTGVNLVSIQRQDTDNLSIFLDNLYAQLLNRPLDQAGLDFWRGVLNSAAGRLGVINGILHSLEGRLNHLRTWYRHFLGRDLDDGGLQFWLGAFDRGASEEQVQAGILESQEFRARAQNMGSGKNANAKFVSAISRVLLDRDADDKMQDFFGNLLQNSNASAVALAVMQSLEFRGRATAGLFQTLLGRDLDDAGRNFFTRLPGLDDIFEQIAESEEFFHRS